MRFVGVVGWRCGPVEGREVLILCPFDDAGSCLPETGIVELGRLGAWLEQFAEA